MRSTRTRSVALALLLALGCAPSGPVRSALQGDLPTLKRDIAKAQRAHALDRNSVRDLAQALAERELISAGGARGSSRVRGLRACAGPLESSLRQRARANDDVAAESTLILLEQRKLGARELVARHAAREEGAWRAVAARAAVTRADSGLRMRFFTDPDERVRHAALAAAFEAREPAELDAVLEAARLDPDPSSRSLAARAAGSIGGERAVLGLKDAWARADDALRMAIVDGWSARASFRAGGERELLWAADAGAGLASVSAAYALVRSGGGEAQASSTRLLRSIADGSDDERRLAITLVPQSEAAEKALLEASKSLSPLVRVAAFGRLLENPKTRMAAFRALREIAAQGQKSKTLDRAALSAREALAAQADPSVRPALLQDLSATRPELRQSAALGLTRLGDFENAATALADDDADVRTSVACAIIGRS